MSTDKLIPVRIPKTAYEQFRLKQKRMNDILLEMGINRRHIPLTRVIDMASKNKIFIRDDKELIQIARRVRK